MLPNFLIIGSQKAVTTSIYHILGGHPEIYFPDIKELNFFFFDHYFEKGIDFYSRNFNNMPPDNKCCGEASPGYICHPEAPARIKKSLPDAKLILTDRNPIERAYSQYWDNRRSLVEPLSFQEVMDRALTETYIPGKLGYFSRGTYIQYIRRYLKQFDHDQLLVLTFDELKKNPAQFYKKIFEFLDVDDSFACDQAGQAYNYSAVWKNPFYQWFLNNNAYQRLLKGRMRSFLFWGPRKRFTYPPLDPAQKSILIDFFKPWNDELADFLDIDLQHWNK